MKKYILQTLAILIVEISMVFFTNSFFVFSQKIERFSNSEGFNQNTVNTIANDNYGFLWIGTPNGLIKYDGYDFKNIPVDFNSHITKLYRDNNNILWIGHNEGLNIKVISLEKTYKVPLKESISISNITSDKKGNIWFSGANKLYVCNLVDAKKGLFNISNNLLENVKGLSSIHKFHINENNTLLLTTSNGVYEVAYKGFETATDASVVEVNKFKEFDRVNVTSVVLIDNIFWVGTIKGLFKVTADGKKLFILQQLEVPGEDKNDINVKSIYEDKSGVVWVGTQNMGMLKYYPDSEKVDWYNYNVSNKYGISSKIVNCFYEDDFGVLWIGTGQGGLNKLNTLQKQFINYTHNPYESNSISGNLTTSILEDSKGYLWVSTYNNSLCRSNQKISDKTVKSLTFKKLKDKIPISENDVIRSIYEDDKGYIWIGTDYSVVLYDYKKDVFKKIKIDLNKKSKELGLCFGITQLDKNRILLAGSSVVVLEDPWKYIDQSTITVKSSLELVNNKVLKVLLDSKKRLWLGTEKGLLKVNYQKNSLAIEKKYSHKNTKDFKLSYNRVFSLKEDSKGNLLVGTFGGGLNILDINESGEVVGLEIFNKDNFLLDNAVYGVLEDQEENLWLSTDMGICKLNPNNKLTNVFDVRDGLLNNNFRQSSYFKGKSGYYYFGGLKGLTIFKPSDIVLNTIPPKVIITKLKVKNKDIEINHNDEKYSELLLKKSIVETKEVVIHQNDQIIALDVAVQHSAVPSKNKLAYKLEGFHNDWVEEDKGKTTIIYTNLSQGSYVLKIKAANSDGIWSDEITELKIKVLPPWYKTWWSYLIFGLIIIASTSGVFIYFIRLEKLQQKLKYEQLDKERIDIANQNKFRFFTNISHEFRTPLSLISGPLERVIEQNEDTNNAKYLAIIQKNTKRLLSLVDQLITFRQAEQGYVNLNLTETTLGEFIYSVTEAFENYSIEKNINFFYKVNFSNEEIIIDIEKTERILFNLLSNSFKNTDAKGSISIEAGINHVGDKKVIEINVVDTGKGIPKEKINNIFERFYQLGKKGENISGGGIGLAFCKSLIELLGGSISAKSKPGVETCFTVTLPSKNKNDYQQDEINKEGKSFIKDWVPLVNKDNNLASTEASMDKYNLLIVEDEEDIQHFLLESLSNKYNITLASNGVEGLEKLKNKEPHLIISDVMMHEMDGFQFCEKIKKDPNTCHIPVVLLTALGEVEDTITGLELGADEYINKPFSVKELELRVNRLIKNNLRKLDHFTKSTALPDEDKIEIPVRDKKFLNNILEIMEENIADSNFGVEELANKVGLSTSQFYRRLKQLTGQVPNVYIRNFRLQRAAELFKSNNGYNVAEVMYQIGIESNSYFSTSFKKLYGVSPSVYLKNNS
ncbi:hypothetical protein AXE80_08905 [Wenyingzhuangia fucanilytica]|uniref:histidine kinase n=1 Tax=Wenyingzhuangia fucanilytica TaxID=1790137 RepID=A0A1B1Y6L9_9FLAO|nr:two-component regulator propeller domain-containing protein [Wenyingzhuangia fucanilytica]ANW96389.1 hypothetical protein AXE80_08905 [Wenyingzhuangia fucanilytica]